MPLSATPLDALLALLVVVLEFVELLDDAVVDEAPLLDAVVGLDAPDALAVAVLALAALDAPPPPPPHAERTIAAKPATAKCLDIPDMLDPLNLLAAKR